MSALAPKKLPILSPGWLLKDRLTSPSVVKRSRLRNTGGRDSRTTYWGRRRISFLGLSMSRMSWGSPVVVGVGFGGAYLGMPEARAAATFDDMALPVSSSSAARIGASAGAFSARTMLDASPAA